MKTKKIAFISSLALIVAGIGYMIFLFFFPYNKVLCHSMKNILNPLSTQLTIEGIRDYGDIKDISEKVEYLEVKSEEDEQLLKKELNVSLPFETGLSYYSDSSLMIISFKGSVMKLSKLTKIRYNKAQINFSFSIENDAILDGSASYDDEEYT